MTDHGSGVAEIIDKSFDNWKLRLFKGSKRKRNILQIAVNILVQQLMPINILLLLKLLVPDLILLLLLPAEVSLYKQNEFSELKKFAEHSLDFLLCFEIVVGTDG